MTQKKTRRSQVEQEAPVDASGSPEAKEDAWSDEQEAALFRSMISWKPVGMHKHFRMLAIVEYLRERGLVTHEEEHIRPAEIWKKLGKLYDLEALDEIEDSASLAYRSDGNYAKEPFYDFDLPREDYRDLTFSRRLASSPPASPPAFPYQLSQEGHHGRLRQSTVEDTDEPRSSPVLTRGIKGTRSSVGRRLSQRAEITRRGTRHSKASVEPSIEDDNEEPDAMEVDADETPKQSKTESAPSTRRSGRKR